MRLDDGVPEESVGGGRRKGEEDGGGGRRVGIERDELGGDEGVGGVAGGDGNGVELEEGMESGDASAISATQEAPMETQYSVPSSADTTTLSRTDMADSGQGDGGTRSG
ncbi:hypothetical protein PIB30_045045 [Stylosanthes scabra]|uniref:Uncharacterized protein n=1 Tax=Stylosanthes scabra TaxID=79078 RepID=A0ABU6SFX3_9FABA|nr:hypothetical protein [Stylosanthes scabra]